MNHRGLFALLADGFLNHSRANPLEEASDRVPGKVLFAAFVSNTGQSNSRPAALTIVFRQ